MQWSQLKKRIRSRLADSVRNRIDFGITSYGPGLRTWECMSRGWIRIDKKEILNFLDPIYRPYDGQPLTPEQEALNVNLFCSDELPGSLGRYLNLSIGQILESDDPLIRAFGMLDARVGRRRLRKMDVSKEHDLVKRLFDLRCCAEGLTRADENVDLTSRLTPASPWRTQRDFIAERRSEAIRRLSRKDRLRDFPSLVSRIRNSDTPEGQLETDISTAVYAGFQNASDPDVLLRTLQFLGSRTKLCGDVLYINAFIAMTRDHGNWLRPLEEWKPTTHNRKKQFASLARHLWARYDVPAFMDNAWLQGNRDQQQWYKDIGQGRNIRHAANLPFPLTKKMAHHFLAAPDHYTVGSAFRWGQVHALGGDQRLADALLETRLVRDFRDDDFCLSLLRFFIRNPMLDAVHIGPIIDYIWNQRYENRIVFVERGVAQDIGPALPNFSMRGRTVDALLRAVVRWHGRLDRESKGENLRWARSQIGEFSLVEGSKRSKNMTIWRIKELLSGRELIEEGRQMHHCVASYARSCHRGRCSIWSMEREADEGREKLVTIEVDEAAKEIRQIRGRRNRLATDQEKAMIKRWASREELEYPLYLL